MLSNKKSEMWLVYIKTVETLVSTASKKLTKLIIMKNFKNINRLTTPIVLLYF